MEKRLVLAFVLSCFVFALWGVLNPPPKRPVRQPEKTQQIANKQDTERPPARPIKPAAIPTTSKVNENIRSLENDFLKAEFSNIGGSLRRLWVKPYNSTIPVTDIMAITDFAQQPFDMESISADTIVYRMEADGMTIRKKYRLAGEYLIEASVEVTNNTEMSKQNNIQIQPFSLDVSSLDKNIENPRDTQLDEYSIATDEKTFRKGGATKFSAKEKTDQFKSVKWVGFRDRYFCLVFKPQYHVDEYRVDPVSEKMIILDTLINGSEIYPQATKEINAIIYMGPQQLSQLKSYNMGFEEIMVFSNWAPLDWVAKLIYGLMNILHRFIPNWGICIIIISLIIYGAMYPLTFKGMMSMKKMQAVQPRLAQLRDKYKDNPQKLNKEMLDLYREHKINPLGGCFPLILQMPVFIGLYQVLWRTVEFKGAGFLWIKDLSSPDRLVTFPFSLPVIGNELNILPLIMIVVMAMQQRITAKNMVITDPAQVTQQKIMQTFFPFFIGFIFYKFASGLSLYFTIFYSLSTLTQWQMSKVKTDFVSK